MAKAKRVFEIAKELGVASKVIVTKCTDEGVPGITNHMSAVKVGLEQTIRQWFSESSQEADEHASTAVETTAKVDLTKARRARRRRTATTTTEDTGGADTAVATEEAPPKRRSRANTSAVSVSPPEPAITDDEATKTPGDDTIALDPPAAAPTQPDTAATETGIATAAPEADVEAAPQAASDTDPAAISGPVGVPNVPSRPTTVPPAGKPLEAPKESVLKGPKLVRIEQPDQINPPRSRRPADSNQNRDGGPGGRTSSGAGVQRTPPRGGRGVISPATADQGRPASKRRSLSTRRGRTADSIPSGPNKFSEQDILEREARLNRAAGFIKQRRHSLRDKPTGVAQASPMVTGGKVEIAEPITIKSFSATTGIKTADIIKYLFSKGVMATINSSIGAEAAMEVALEYNIELEVKEQQTAEQVVLSQFEQRDEIDVRPRPPVVTVLGHVDHGKTSLLDRIRSADVASGEAGGITQHVGAYRITVKGNDDKDKTVVFLDTPGHEAFTAMRARGAGLTDLVVLVVAADDGVMPQTIESINHAKAAGVPIVVALNKIDRAEATDDNIRRIFGQLAEHGLNPVEWGGTAEIVKVSAIEGTGVSDLLEILDYQAELLELTSDHGGAARGTVIETEMQPGRGPVARVLVQEGNIKVGDFIVIGRAYGRVRDMTDDRAKPVKEAGPSTPLELSGIDMVPDAGDKFFVTDTLKQAEEVASQFREAERNRQLASKTKVTLDNFADTIAAGGVKELRVVLKADVQGSIDVLAKSLSQLGDNKVTVKVLHAAVGGITESDVLLADASEAVVVGFHVTASPRARELAEQRDVDVRLYKIIYEITESITKALEGLLEPEFKEEKLGTAEVRQVFKITKLGAVAGCLVTEGAIVRSGKIRLTRDDIVITEDRGIETLRRVKEDAKEVRAGTECGVRIDGYEDIKAGDMIHCYNVVTVAPRLG